ncbi:PREDICTED: protein unc-119 homolog B-like [Amphimedon queenslandica]|uniref:GMP phosphodiesterase delta subunit domain-containing protein n=1 Tax=Amphimedon queenslandica TaxID=400682 RepID=A0A1X7V9R6_AMPQE|nr:PREDICTED: protein unc-119 homolog B-like [Amphimedon queenslandica]|eukprot:XP_003385192.1 PREDICTED: protein unc-119 homolog B-like [Amphimedon queenslandica]
MSRKAASLKSTAAAATKNKEDGKGGVVPRVTEADLLSKKPHISPEDVLKLDRATESYLCPLQANIYDIEFTRFKLRDLDSNQVLFEVSKPQSSPDDKSEKDDESRFVRYHFPIPFLDLKTLGATIEFTVGDREVKDFRMIERHFFRDKCLKSFDFNFGFCMPTSRNTCEHIYEMPVLLQSEKEELISHPYETKSDSFYFVNGKLVMHHRADYAYVSAND